MIDHHTTRRGRRRNSVPIAAMAGPAPASSTNSADRKLFKIEAEVRALDARMQAVSRSYFEAEETMFEWRRLNPEPVMQEIKPARASSRALVRQLCETEDLTQVTVPGRPSVKARREHAVALKDWKMRRDAARKECNFCERQAAYNGLLDQICNLCGDAVEIQATALDGLQCKARLFMLNDNDDELAHSIVTDLLAWKGRAAS